MALNLVDGIMGAGKTYVGTNFFIWDELRNGDRHIYTNLPIKPEVIAKDLAGGRPTKRREILERLHILENKMSPVLDADGNPIMVPSSEHPNAAMVPLVLNEIQCFWRFTQPNSVIVLDECADWFNARNWKAVADLGMEKNELQSYVNHHRHYKDDLYVICQNIEDIDKQIRTKFHHLYRIANSLKENMFEWRFLKGIKWPIQFFKVRVYHPRNLKEEEESFTVWPRAAGFKRYDSFSASERLPGKKMPPKDAASSDFGQSYWKRMSLWLARSWQLVMWMGFGAGLIGGVGWVVYGLVVMDSNTLATVMTPTDKNPAHVTGAAMPTATASPSSDPSPTPPAGAVAAAKEAIKATPPHPILVTARYIAMSDGKRLTIGDNYDGAKIIHFDLDFIYLEGGRLERTGL